MKATIIWISYENTFFTTYAIMVFIDNNSSTKNFYCISEIINCLY